MNLSIQPSPSLTEINTTFESSQITSTPPPPPPQSLSQTPLVVFEENIAPLIRELENSHQFLNDGGITRKRAIEFISNQLERLKRVDDMQASKHKRIEMSESSSEETLPIGGDLEKSEVLPTQPLVNQQHCDIQIWCACWYDKKAMNRCVIAFSIWIGGLKVQTVCHEYDRCGYTDVEFELIAVYYSLKRLTKDFEKVPTVIYTQFAKLDGYIPNPLVHYGFKDGIYYWVDKITAMLSPEIQICVVDKNVRSEHVLNDAKAIFNRRAMIDEIEDDDNVLSQEY